MTLPSNEIIHQNGIIPKSRFQQLQDDIEAWSDPTFGFNRAPASSLNHLIEEVKEVAAAPHDHMEWADCFMLLIDAARRAGLNADAIIDATYAKLAINKARKWGKPNAEGYCKHSKKTQEEVTEIIRQWHLDRDDNRQLHEALGWTFVEYATYVEQGIIP